MKPPPKKPLPSYFSGSIDFVSLHYESIVSPTGIMYTQAYLSSIYCLPGKTERELTLRQLPEKLIQNKDMKKLL